MTRHRNAPTPHDGFQHHKDVRAYSPAVFFECHSTPPPPVAAYEAWFAEWAGNTSARARATDMDAKKMRRVIVMRRGGYTLKECAHSIGVSLRSLQMWIDKLPGDLRS